MSLWSIRALLDGRPFLYFFLFPLFPSLLSRSLSLSAVAAVTVVIWDLNRASKTKHDFHYGEHRRTVHRVEIHPTEGNLILTGSQDSSMKIFDRRERGVTHNFCSSSEAVRDVQFNPNQTFKFAAALESGWLMFFIFRFCNEDIFVSSFISLSLSLACSLALRVSPSLFLLNFTFAVPLS